jgi:hypothetical protein
MITVICSASLSIVLSLKTVVRRLARQSRRDSRVHHRGTRQHYRPFMTDLFAPDRRKYMIDGMWIKRRFSKYEHCVGCREVTDIRKDIDISIRHHYIEGSGQLCYECYMLIYPNELPIVVPTYD